LLETLTHGPGRGRKENRKKEMKPGNGEKLAFVYHGAGRLINKKTPVLQKF
jgi:hypothetical protein